MKDIKLCHLKIWWLFILLPFTYLKGNTHPEYDFLSLSLPLHASCMSAPAYVKVKDDIPVMQIAVLNQTRLICPELLKKILKVLKTQVERDFTPYYGISVEFKVFSEECPLSWQHYVPMVLPDLLAYDPGAVLAFHDLQDSTSFNGDPISLWLFDPPPLPDGTPYMIIPMGTPTTEYGVIPASLSHDPTLPPTFESILSHAMSHELLDTLANYAINRWSLLYTGDSFDFYAMEVCDPVEFTPGYVIKGLYVSNFVLPSWFVPGLYEGPFDFLDTVPAPFTPFNGACSLLRAQTSYPKFGFYTLASLPDDPYDLIEILQQPIYSFAPETLYRYVRAHYRLKELKASMSLVEEKMAQ